MRHRRPLPTLLLLVACLAASALGPAGHAEPAETPEAFGGRDHEVDLRPEIERRGIPYRRQGRHPTCSIHAVAFLLEFAYSKILGPEFADLSDDYLNHAANLAIGKKDDGDFFHSATQGHAVYGIVREGEMPRRPRYDFGGTEFSDALVARGRSHRDRAGLLAHWIRPLDGTKGLSTAQMERVLEYLARGIPVATGRGHSRSSWATACRRNTQAAGSSYSATAEEQARTSRSRSPACGSP